MLFIAIFEDDPAQTTVRTALMDAHLDYLNQHAETIRVAGSLRTAPDTVPQGACWIVEATDTNAVETLCHEDPFWRGGLRKKLTVLHWSKAFADRMTPI